MTWWVGLELKHYPKEALQTLIMEGVDEDGIPVGPGLRLSASRLWLERELDSDVAVKAKRLLNRVKMAN